MLTAAKEARMQATVASSFIDTVVVKRPGAAVDAEGNPTNALTTVLTIPGRWQAAPSGIRQSEFIGQEIADQAGQQVAAVVTVAPGTDIRPGDRIEVRGLAWRVATVFDRRLHERVNLERVTT